MNINDLTPLNYEPNSRDNDKLFAEIKIKNKRFSIFLEGQGLHQRVVYNPAHLINHLPNRCVFETDEQALYFIQHFGHLLIKQ